MKHHKNTDIYMKIMNNKKTIADYQNRNFDNFETTVSIIFYIIMPLLVCITVATISNSILNGLIASAFSMFIFHPAEELITENLIHRKAILIKNIIFYNRKINHKITELYNLIKNNLKLNSIKSGDIKLKVMLFDKMNTEILYRSTMNDEYNKYKNPRKHYELDQNTINIIIQYANQLILEINGNVILEELEQEKQIKRQEYLNKLVKRYNHTY